MSELRDHPAAATPEPARSWFTHRYFFLALLALVLLFTASVRWRLRATPLERDEGEYAYAGQLILQGIPPYKLAYNMKFPGMYMAYAAIMALFGQTSTGIHLGFLLVNAITIVLVYLLTSRLADRAAGCVAAATYAYGSLSGAFVGIWAHATHFVVVFALAGLLLLWHARGKKPGGKIFFSGALLAISMLMKQHGVFFIAFGGAYLIYDHARTREWRKLVRALTVFSLGVALPLLSTGFWLWRTGVFPKFWFWTIQYARTYAGQFRGVAEIQRSLGFYTPNLIWILLAFALPALLILWRKADRAPAVFATGFLAASVLATVPGFNFTWHYFILPLPALTLLPGVVLSAAAQYFHRRQPRANIIACWPFAIFAVALLLGIASERELFFRCPPAQAPRLVYGPGFPFEESVQIADYLKLHAGAGDRIAIIGSEPQIYFYTHRHSATGYIYTYALMEPQPFALRMQKEMIAEVEASQPEYLVYVDLPSSWIIRHESNRLIFDWFRKYAAAGYEVVGAVDTDERKVLYYWDTQAPAYETRAEILIYKRTAGKNHADTSNK